MYDFVDVIFTFLKYLFIFCFLFAIILGIVVGVVALFKNGHQVWGTAAILVSMATFFATLNTFMELT